MHREALPIRFEGNRLARAALSTVGWRVNFHGLPARQGVLIAYPHTSNWDFVVGMMAKTAVGLPISFWGKDTLFKVPGFGRWLRWMGGIPVARSTASNQVDAMVRRFEQARERDQMLWLALAPEGTRGWQPRWRSGFYHLALKAGVPLGIARLDWARREVDVEAFLTLSGNLSQDRAAIARALAGVQGKHAADAAPIEF
jgi:1-acyl-sn-glycerol-3-phosphate acyltransferase